MAVEQTKIRKEKKAASGLPFSLARFFSWVSLVLVLVSSAILALFIGNTTTTTLLDSQEEYALLLAENLNKQIFRRFTLPVTYASGRVALGDPVQYKLLDEVVQSLLHGLRIETIRIYDNNYAVTYSTNHELLDAGVLDELVPWKDIEALGEYVSGVGTYTTTFTLPEDWDSTGKKVMFEADSFNLGTAMIMVNDQKAVVNMDACEADLTDLVKAGENTISVRVTSSLCNVARSYDGISWITEETPAADYGMTGNAVITISNIE